MGDDRELHGFCALCKTHCPAVFQVRDGRLVAVQGDTSVPGGGILCIKGRAAPELLYSEQRLRYPLRRTRPRDADDPGWRRISWDEALDTIAGELRRIRSAYGAAAVAFARSSPSGSALSDSSPFLTRLQHQYGSPNGITSVHVCNWHQEQGAELTFGSVLPEPDVLQARTILLWGHNPSANRIMLAQDIVRARRAGAKLIVVDPRRVGVGQQADLWLPVRPGADAALALGLTRLLIERQGFDAEFVERWTNAPFLVRPDGRLLNALDLNPAGPAGYLAVDPAGLPRPVDQLATVGSVQLDAELKVHTAGGESLRCQTVWRLLRERCRPYDPVTVERLTGVPARSIEAAAELLATARPVSLFHWTGLAQHGNATQTVRAVQILWGLTGSFDRRGGNLLHGKLPFAPVAGTLPAGTPPALGADERPIGPPRNGWIRAVDAYDALLADPPRLRGLVAFGANVLLGHPETARGLAALRRLEFFAVAELFETPTARLADIVLPAATFMESESFDDAARQLGDLAYVVHRPRIVEPIGEARPDLQIALDLAVRLGYGEQFWQGDPAAALDFRLQPLGLSLAGLRERGWVAVPNPVREQQYRATGFPTPSGRFELYSTRLADAGLDPLPSAREPAYSPFSRPDLAERYPLVLTNSKLSQFCHSQGRALPMLRRQVPEPFVELHPATASEYGIVDGAWVAVETPEGRMRARARLTSQIRPGVACTQHGWWQPCEPLGLPGYDLSAETGSNANATTTRYGADPISGATPHRSTICRIVPD